MIATLTRIYLETKNEAYLTAAVSKKWITGDDEGKVWRDEEEYFL